MMLIGLVVVTMVFAEKVMSHSLSSAKILSDNILSLSDSGSHSRYPPSSTFAALLSFLLDATGTGTHPRPDPFSATLFGFGN